MKVKTSTKWLHAALCGCGLLAALTATGCQVTVGGQTLPSPYYHTDDVQYFAPGPEFILSKEAAAQKAYNAEQKLQQTR
ncbi:MAG: hypothetical protein U0935_19685 [Pirellulales bacterium]